MAAVMAAGCSRQESGWETAAERNTVAAYEDYLNRFPDGAHAEDARARILGLREADAWADAQRLRVPEALQRYLADWPDGAHAAQARRELAEFAPIAPAAPVAPVAPPAPLPGHAAQLGAYSSEAAARASIARLLLEQSEILGGRNWMVIAPAEGAPALWRLRIGPMPEPEARGLCSSLRARGVDCVPVAG